MAKQKISVVLLPILSSTARSFLEIKALRIHSVLKVISSSMAHTKMQRSEDMFTAVPRISLLEIQPVEPIDFCLK